MLAHGALVVLGVAVALAGPRLRTTLLTLATAALAAALWTGLVFAGPLPLWGGGLLLGLLAALVVLLPHLAPRGLLGLLLLALLATALPPGKLPDLPPAAWYLAGGVTLVGAVALVLKESGLALRLACALLGGRLVAAGLPLHAWWLPLAAAGVLGAIDVAFPAPTRPATDPLLSFSRRKPAPTGPALAAFVVVTLLSLFGWRLLPVLPEARPHEGALEPLPFAARRATLAQAAPHGGLVWPLPSEALTWTEPNHDLEVQPRFDNLDAVYLGANPRSFYRLPGSDLRGALSLHGPISKLRLLHDAPALARLRAAAQATVAALHDVLPLLKPGVPEKQVELAVLAAMQAHGCGRESFPLILASGPSAAEPHGSGNLGVLGEGTLLVADIGCTVDHYASDFTRTLPVSGKFSPEQRVLYDAVHAAQAAALAACKPGAQLMARAKPGVVSLTRLARDTLKDRAPDHQDHMSHGLGHTVGLFVHDVMNDGALVEGMVVTIEPGTYLEGKLGIRIEDTYVVTKDGCQPLTTGFASDSAAIEAVMAKAQAPAPVAPPKPAP